MAQTPCKRVSDGIRVPYTFSADAAVGDVVEVGSQPCIVAAAVDYSEQPIGTLDVGGMWDIPQVAGVITAGDAVYWDNNGTPYGGTASSGCATGTASGNYLMGWAAPIQPNATTATTATDSYVRVVLTSATRTATIAGAVTATDLTGSDSSLGIAGFPSTTGGAIAITGGTSSTAATAGGAVSVTGGTPGVTGVGGAVTITSGAGGATSGASGVVTIGSGTVTATASGASGAVTLQSAAGATGTGATAGASGAVTIQSGAGGAGTAYNGGAGGTVTITGGVGGATSATDTGGAGAAVNITAGAGGTAAGAGTGGAGGNVSLTAGAAGGASSGTGGAAGTAIITAGAGNTATAGGLARLIAGQGGATGAGGAAYLTAGAGGSTSGTGGAVYITAGAGTNGNANSGAVTILSGAPHNTGTAGNVTVDCGNHGSGTAGTLALGNTYASAITLGRTAGTVAVPGTMTFAKMFRIPVNASVAVGGTAQANANAVSEGFTVVTGADDTAAIKLPTAVAGAIVIVKSSTDAKNLVIFPNTDDAVNALGANNSFNMATDVGMALLVACDATTWYALPVAG